MTDLAPRTAAAIAFMESVEAAVLDPAIAKMVGASGQVVLALVSPDAIRDALAEAEAAASAAPGLDVEALVKVMHGRGGTCPTGHCERFAAEYAQVLLDDAREPASEASDES